MENGFLSPPKSMTVTKKQLVIGEKVTVSLDNNEEATIYIDAYSKTLVLSKYSLNQTSQITLGNSENNTIVYDDYDMKPNHATITIENSRATISVKKKNMLYVNGMKTTSSILSFGDIIHIMSLKMIYLGDALAIYQSIHFTACHLTPYIPKQVEEDTEEEQEEIEVNDDRFFSTITSDY